MRSTATIASALAALLLRGPPAAAAPAIATASTAASRPATPSQNTLRNGDDLAEAIRFVTLLDGAWGAALTLAWIESARSPAGQAANGAAGVIAARLLNGSVWTWFLALELAAIKTIGGGWGWLERASARSDQLFGFGVPSECALVGASGGCGLGLGGFGEMRGKVRDLPLWLVISGGWMQGRVAADEARTVMESTWVVSPLALEAELTGKVSDVAASVALGPGIYAGLHTAHVHGETAEVAARLPWHELVPLSGGAGLGLRADAAISFGRRFSIEASAVLAPFVSASATSLDPLVAPVRVPAPDGPLFWRTLSAGASVQLPGEHSPRIGLRLWGGALSSRPFSTAGHQAVSIHWDIPLRP